MKVMPLEDYRPLTTQIHLIKGKVYEAELATNQPDWEEEGKIFITNAEGDDPENPHRLLLGRCEYKIADIKIADNGCLLPVGESLKSGGRFYSTHPPEDFFAELVEKKDKQPGMVYVNDRRRPRWEGGKWVAYYAFPTDLAKLMSRHYQLGVGPTGFEVIECDNGQLLTIMSNYSEGGSHFRFDFWAGLTPEENDVQKVLDS